MLLPLLPEDRERAGKGIILLWISVRTEDYFGMATGLLYGRMNTSS